VTLNLRFPGQCFDKETGLHYNYFRTYDPSTGRYLESDPIGLDGGLNTYTYVLNNPLIHMDLFGLTQEDINSMLDLARETQNDLAGDTWEIGKKGVYADYPLCSIRDYR